MAGIPAPESKTALIMQLLAAGLSKAEVMVRAKCSQTLVYKILQDRAQDIARLKAGQPLTDPGPGHAGLGGPIRLPKVKRVRVPKLPPLDPARPAAPQLEQMAWSVIAEAAAGGEISTKQQQAAREIIKQALRDRVAPPVDRQLVFKVDVIDVVDDKFVPTGQVTYEIRP